VTERLLTTTEAALLAGRKPATIRTWAARGHLKAAGLDRAGRPLYAVEAVWDVERDTRRRSRSGRPRRTA
jgi:hypothetical protein